MDDRRPNFVTAIARMTGLSGGEKISTFWPWHYSGVSRTETNGRPELLYHYRPCRSYCWCWIAVIVVYLSQYLLLLMQNLASKILCIFVTGGAYAPYAPCLFTPLQWTFTRHSMSRHCRTQHRHYFKCNNKTAGYVHYFSKTQ